MLEEKTSLSYTLVEDMKVHQQKQLALTFFNTNFEIQVTPDLCELIAQMWQDLGIKQTVLRLVLLLFMVHVQMYLTFEGPNILGKLAKYER